MDKENWRLDKIKIEFKHGYSFNETEAERHDRYEGFISFANGVKESFNLRIPSDRLIGI